jgi:hypothetical protein
MGLEVATFISQLVATNPVGATDPKSQGDDHLRLLKAVLLNTLPALNAAVNTTPAELNAIHGTQWVNPNVGTALAPAYTFTGDTDTGMYHRAANSTSFAANGALILDIGSSGMDLQAGTLGVPIGNSLLPGFHFVTDTDTGIYSAGANILTVSCGNTAVASFTTTALNFGFVPTQVADGNSASPGLQFSADPDTGIYRASANTLVIAAGGAVAGVFTNTTNSSSHEFGIQDGINSLPGLFFANDSDTGLYRVGTNQAALVVGGQSAFEAVQGGVGGIIIGSGMTATVVPWTINSLVSAGASAGGGIALPATVAGFLQWTINGVTRKIPYYAA